MESKMLSKEDLIELVNYLSQSKEVQLLQKYQRLLQEILVKENAKHDDQK